VLFERRDDRHILCTAKDNLLIVQLFDLYRVFNRMAARRNAQGIKAIALVTSGISGFASQGS